MTWRWVALLTVLVAAAEGAALLWGDAPGVAEGPYRKREAVACVCREVRP